MSRFHVSINKEVVRCQAETVEECRRKNFSPHFTSKEAGEDYLREQFEKSHGVFATKKVTKKLTLPKSIEENKETAAACRKFYAQGINVSFQTDIQDMMFEDTEYSENVEDITSSIDVVTDDFTVNSEEIFALGNPLRA